MNEDIKQALLNYNFKDPILGEKWIKRYIRFVEGCQSKQFDYQNERIHIHHILPRSWGGTDDHCNLIMLPIRHHVVAHHLLSYTKDRKMRYAFRVLVHKILEDKNFNYASSLQLIEKSRYMTQRPVVNLNTGEEFKSASAADIHYGLNVGSIGSALCSQCRAGGYFWQYKDIVDQSSVESCLQYYLDKAAQGRANIIASVATPVIDIFSGETFNTSYDADVALGTTKGSVKTCIRAQTSVKGRWFVMQREVDERGIDVVRNEINAIIHNRYLKHAVVNLNTGKVFETTREVSIEIGHPISSVRSAINNKIKLGGYWWVKKEIFDQIGQEKLLEEYSALRNKKRTGNYKRCAIINLIDNVIYNKGQDVDKMYGKCPGWYYSVIKHQRFTDQYYLVPLDEYQNNQQYYDEQFNIWKNKRDIV